MLVIAHVKIQFEINSQPIIVDADNKVTCDCSHGNYNFEMELPKTSIKPTNTIAEFSKIN